MCGKHCVETLETDLLVKSLLHYFRIDHFDYVKVEDLEKIGMGKPAIRRLLDAIKRKKTTFRKKTILDKVRCCSHHEASEMMINCFVLHFKNILELASQVGVRVTYSSAHLQVYSFANSKTRVVYVKSHN